MSLASAWEPHSDKYKPYPWPFQFWHISFFFFFLAACYLFTESKHLCSSSCHPLVICRSDLSKVINELCWLFYKRGSFSSCLCAGTSHQPYFWESLTPGAASAPPALHRCLRQRLHITDLNLDSFSAARRALSHVGTYCLKVTFISLFFVPATLARLLHWVPKGSC